MSSGLRDTLAGLTDPEWLDLLAKGGPAGLLGFPPADFQTITVGASDEQALREAFNFYRTVKSYAFGQDIRITDTTRVLDFGCGWGRITRFFLKDVAADNLWGVDVDGQMIELCRRLVHFGRYATVAPEPPTFFDARTFDVVYAYSVFSHLAEPVHIQWVKEFRRILRPGGLLVVTTMPRDFLEYCRSLRGSPQETPFHRALAASFVDTEASLAAYDRGQFLYAPTGGGPALPSWFYGISLIPKPYVMVEWGKYLKLVDFTYRPEIVPQALIVMQCP